MKDIIQLKKQVRETIEKLKSQNFNEEDLEAIYLSFKYDFIMEYIYENELDEYIYERLKNTHSETYTNKEKN